MNAASRARHPVLFSGGTGPFANVRGEIAAANLGFNETSGGDARYEVTLAS